jgi:hypothetical protein
LLSHVERSDNLCFARAKLFELPRSELVQKI